MSLARFGSSLTLLALLPVAAAQQIDSTIEPAGDGTFVRGTAEAVIIDTRDFQPQVKVGAPWEGEIKLIKHDLPLHTRHSVNRRGVENDLPVGELRDEPRAFPMPFFPGIQQTAWAPPDPTIAVGPDHIVETVNMVIAFFTKDGTMTFSQNLDSTGSPGFFEDIGGGTFTFDPKCFYDPYENRFVVLALEVYGASDESYITIAVSDDDDPHGIWYKYRTDSRTWVGSSSYWTDYPGLGYDDTGYYVTANLFKLTGGGSGFGGVLFRTFDKTPMLSGAPVTFNTLRASGGASAQVAQHHTLGAAPLFVDVATSSSIRVYAIDDPHGSPSLLSTTVSVPSFSTSGGGAPNLGGSTLSIVDSRIMNVHFRNGNLFSGHRIWRNSRNQSRWYHFDTANWPVSGSVTLVQSGNIDGGAGVHTWFPAIAQNADGEIGLVTAMSSSVTFASVQVTGRRPGDPLGTMGPLSEIHIGTSGYNTGRWGDYFDITTDPRNDRTFWVVGEYANTTNAWGTAIGRFLVTPVVGDMNCDSSFDGADIDPFFLAVGDPDAYNAAFPQCDPIAADANGDDTVDGADIDAFFALLGGP